MIQLPAPTLASALAALALFQAPAAADGAATEDALAQASPEARDAWQRVCAAGRAEGSAPEPIRAFTLRADVLTRDGAQSNEAEVAYRYLAPDLIRFSLPSGRETGKGPGIGRSAYWLKDKDEVVTLDGREHGEDVRLVRQMLAVARNFVALSDPARLRLERLERMDQAPRGLPPSVSRKAGELSWLRVTSPDFALLPRGEDAPRPASRAGPSYRVELGLGADGLPRLAVIAEEPAHDGSGQPPAAAPLLIELADYRAVDGFLVPHRLLVHPRTSGEAALFVDRAAQEIYVLEARLRPALREQDFLPGG